MNLPRIRIPLDDLNPFSCVFHGLCTFCQSCFDGFRRRQATIHSLHISQVLKYILNHYSIFCDNYNLRSKKLQVSHIWEIVQGETHTEFYFVWKQFLELLDSVRTGFFFGFMPHILYTGMLILEYINMYETNKAEKWRKKGKKFSS